MRWSSCCILLLAGCGSSIVAEPIADRSHDEQIVFLGKTWERVGPYRGSTIRAFVYQTDGWSDVRLIEFPQPHIRVTQARKPGTGEWFDHGIRVDYRGDGSLGFSALCFGEFLNNPQPVIPLFDYDIQPCEDQD